MTKVLRILVTLALMGPSLLPSIANAQSVDADTGIVSYDTSHSGASRSFHLDAGNYDYSWDSSAPDPEYPDLYCGVRLAVVTDNGTRGQDTLVNEPIHYAGGSFFSLNGLPSGRYTFTVFGCGDFSSFISPSA